MPNALPNAVSTAAAPDPDPALALSFGTVAAQYARSRPDYAPAAIDFALAGLRPKLLLDLAAGTGKLTMGLIGRADRLVAVEPDPAMRAELAAGLPAVPAVAGTAENLDFANGSVDAILVGQAFHWFRRPDADVEMARVLRRGGIAGLLWNLPDTDVSWVARLYELTPFAGWSRLPQKNLRPDLFDVAEQAQFDTVHKIDGVAGLLALVRTWSWVISLPEPEQLAIDTAVRALATEHPELRQPVIELPQRTTVVRQFRR